MIGVHIPKKAGDPLASRLQVPLKTVSASKRTGSELIHSMRECLSKVENISTSIVPMDWGVGMVVSFHAAVSQGRWGKMETSLRNKSYICHPPSSAFSSGSSAVTAAEIYRTLTVLVTHA